MKELIKSHKFFMHESQHYIMGNWSKYEPLIKQGSWNKKKWEYLKGFIPAYFRFMKLSIKG